MVEVKWTSQSIEDIGNIAEYIAADSEKYAALQVEKFFERVEILTENPFAGRMVPETGRRDIRELISGSYRIIYSIISDKRIDIITVHHGARLLKHSPAYRSIKKKK